MTKIVTVDRRHDWYFRAAGYLLQKMEAEFLMVGYRTIHARFAVGRSIQHVSMSPRDFVARYWAEYR